MYACALFATKVPREHTRFDLKWLNVSYMNCFMCFTVLFILDSCVVNLQGVPACKKRRLGVILPSLVQQDNWISDFNLDGRINTSQSEVGDGATSRVYMDDNTVAVKQLKCYSPRLAPALIQAYNQLFK